MSSIDGLQCEPVKIIIRNDVRESESGFNVGLSYIIRRMLPRVVGREDGSPDDRVAFGRPNCSFDRPV